MTERLSAAATVIGLGNILCGDEGIGVRACEILWAAFDFQPPVLAVDGGTLGQNLYGFVVRSRRLLVLDCVDEGLPPGAVVRKSSLPAWLGMAKASPHQGSFAEVVALAALKGKLPSEMALVGMQPESLEYGQTLSRPAVLGLGKMIESALEVLATWGIGFTPACSRRFLTDSPVGIQHCQPDLLATWLGHFRLMRARNAGGLNNA